MRTHTETYQTIQFQIFSPMVEVVEDLPFHPDNGEGVARARALQLFKRTYNEDLGDADDGDSSRNPADDKNYIYLVAVKTA